MSSDCKILFSEGQGQIIFYDNGITITYPLNDEEFKEIEDVISGKKDSSTKTRVFLSVNKLKCSQKERDIIEVKLSGENSDVMFGFWRKDLLHLIER